MSVFSSIVVLTGAGISAESGLSTFRDPDGIWAKYDIEEVATPEAFSQNPELVHGFYNDRRSALKEVEPNAAHLALAKLEEKFAGGFAIVTQNVDNLHERGGSKNIIHMHGELAKAWCLSCGERYVWHEDLSPQTKCEQCAQSRCVRPDVVWFGEYPYQMERIWELLEKCDLFVSIGTSGNVYPAAQFVQQAGRFGAHTLELNLEPSAGVSDFAETVHGKATEIVPQWVEEILS